MACRLDPEPWFVNELKGIFSYGGSDFRLKWDHRAGRWALEEKPQIGRWYHIMWIYPFEQHRETLRMLRRSNVRNPQHQEDFNRAVSRVDHDRIARTRRMQDWSVETMKQVGQAASFPTSRQGKKDWHHEKSYAEGLQKEIEHGHDSESD